MPPESQSRKGPRATPLRGTARAWRIEGGPADVYLAAADGPRRHLLRIASGEIITGFADGIGEVLCVPAADATLHELAGSALLTPSELGAWIRILAASLQAPWPRALQTLHPGETSALDRLPVSSDREVLWVRSLDAPAHLFGDRSLPIFEAGAIIPLVAPAWLAPEAATRFESVTVTDDPDARATALNRFTTAVRHHWEHREAADQAALARRAQRQQYADVERMREALRGLSAPLGAVLPEGPSASKSSDALLLRCLRRIGKSEGIVFQAPHGELADSEQLTAEDIARASRVHARPVTLTSLRWTDDHGSLLALRIDGSPVALIPGRLGYRCYDPRDGQDHPIDPTLGSTLQSDGLSFYPPLPEGKVGGRKLATFAFHGMASEFARLFALSIMSAIVALALPVIAGRVFDTMLPMADRRQLAVVVLVLVLAAVVTSLLNMVQSSLLLRVQGRIESRVQSAVWDRILNLPASFLRRYSTGDLATRGLSVETMRQVLTGVAIKSMLSLISGAVSFVLLLHYDATLAAKSLVLVALAVIFILATSTRELILQRRMSLLLTRLSGLTLGLFSGIAKLRGAAAEPRAFLEWSRHYASKVELEMKARRVKIWSATITAFWSAFSIACLFALYSLELRAAVVTAGPKSAPPMSTGAFIAFLTAFGMLMRSVLGASSTLLDLVGLRPAYELARPLLEEKEEVSTGRTYPGELSGAVELHGVSFRYQEDRPEVIRNVSLRIAPGEFVAIVGSSGSGKSTLLRLLLGFEQPTQGEVRYDGRDLNTLDPREVRRQIGVVLQTGRIRAGSLLENILGGSIASTDDAWEAARMAGLDADIAALPMGMHTVLSEGGGTLSGGQRQRVLIARALVKRPRLLYFDEATSALDNHTQATVSASLGRLAASRLVIAHRLTTIARADRICVMKAGELVEVGAFDDLMQRNGEFAKLARRQML